MECIWGAKPKQMPMTRKRRDGEKGTPEEAAMSKWYGGTGTTG